MAAQGLPKFGNSDEEYEDAYFPLESYATEASIFRAAVADGATETSFSAQWARQLVQAYCHRRFRPIDRPANMERLRSRWRAATGSIPLPWYAEEKRKLGAFAALVGLTIEAGPADGPTKDSGTWTALAAGDCCLFQIRGRTIVCSFPMKRSEEFSNHPMLVSSLGNACVEPGLFRVAGGIWQVGDSFLLASDALSSWLLGSSRPAGGRAVQLQRIIDLGQGFEEMIGQELSAGRLRNDDMTALSVWVDGT